VKSQLRLALTWDRIDIAEKFIFDDDKNWEVGQQQQKTSKSIST
jgi:hypothetical protein